MNDKECECGKEDCKYEEEEYIDLFEDDEAREAREEYSDPWKEAGMSIWDFIEKP